MLFGLVDKSGKVLTELDKTNNLQLLLRMHRQNIIGSVCFRPPMKRKGSTIATVDFDNITDFSKWTLIKYFESSLLKTEELKEQFSEIVDKLLITEDTDLLVGGSYILTKNSKVNDLFDAKVYYMGGQSLIKNAYNSNIHEMFDVSSVNNLVGGWVGSMCNYSSVVIAKESAVVFDMYESACVYTMLHSSRIGKMVHNSSVTEMFDNSTIDLIENSGVVKKVCGRGFIRKMTNNSTVYFLGPEASVGELEDNASVFRNAKETRPVMHSDIRELKG